MIDVGTVIAEGTSDELKDRIGGEVLELHVDEAANLPRVAEALTGVGAGEPTVDDDARLVRIPVGSDGFGALRDSVRRLDEGKIWVADIALHRPTLDDVFLSLTGRGADEGHTDEESDVQPSQRKRRKKKDA